MKMDLYFPKSIYQCNIRINPERQKQLHSYACKLNGKTGFGDSQCGRSFRRLNQLVTVFLSLKYCIKRRNWKPIFPRKTHFISFVNNNNSNERRKKNAKCSFAQCWAYYLFTVCPRTSPTINSCQNNF